MKMHKWIRQFHRWVALAFVLCVIATSIALAQRSPPAWMSYLPLLPLALLSLSGIYLFALPCFARRPAGAPE